MPKSGYKLVKSLFQNNPYSLNELPESWKYLKLEQTGELINGLNKDKEDYGHGCLHVNIDNIFESLRIKSEKLGRVNASNEEIGRYCLQKGDICLLRSSVKREGVGYPALFDGHKDPVVFSGFIIRFRPKKERWNSLYLTYLMRTDFIRQNVVAFSTSSANTNINQKSLGAIPTPIPSLLEQQKIATILSNVDNLISSYDNIIVQTKSLKKGLMQTLLTRGIGHKKFKKVKWLFGKEIEIPEEWDYQNLKLTTKLVGGYAFKSEDYVGNGVSLLKISNVGHDNLIWNDESFLPDDYWNKNVDYQIHRGDLVMAMTRPIISTGIKISRVTDNKKILLNQRVGKFLTTMNIDFLNYVINSKYFIIQIERGLSESNQPNISSSEVEAAKIWYPENIQEQQRIAMILSKVDDKISELESKKTHLEKIKKGLMQKLLTGQIRVKV